WADDPAVVRFARANLPDQSPAYGPILLLQGTADRTIPEPLTREAAAHLCKLGDVVQYQTYEGMDHDPLVDASFRDQIGWIAARFAGQPAHGNCHGGRHMTRLSRRSVLGTAVAGATLARLGRAASPSGAPTAGNTVEVTTTHGKVAGYRKDGTCIFKGIPYGASTAGLARFQPPRPPDPWTGTLSATEDPPAAPQSEPGSKRTREVPASLADIEPDWPVLPESEDCLKLDLWTPAVDDHRRPVMVWFHGGGFAVGSAAGDWQDGARLSQHADVVVVSVNHRLNVLGHLFLDRLDPHFAGAGNAGLLDLVLA